jgi:multidrug resistance protein
MAVLSPLVSSVFTPAISQIADTLGTSKAGVVGAVTGYVVMLGIGPLIIAPLSETFGRRPLYIVCFSIFTLLQIPTALSPNISSLIAVRTLAGFFGSVGIANGGGTLNDLFDPSERATVYGWYLLGPLLGPTLGPLVGGMSEFLLWRWMFGILAIVCAINTAIGYFFLHETFAPKILARRCRQLEKKYGGRYSFEGEDTRPMFQKVLQSPKRPIRILLTPIVFPIAIYQALIFSIMYTIYTNMESMFGPSSNYGLSTFQTSLLYLGFGAGFFIAVRGLVPRIDTIYNALGRKYSPARPEYRLPLANVGAFALPLTLFWFGWTLEYQLPLAVVVLATPIFGLAQIAIMNSVQNYFIDAYSQYAASAIAAGALFRSLVGGVVPLAGPTIFRKCVFHARSLNMQGTNLPAASGTAGDGASLGLWPCSSHPCLRCSCDTAREFASDSRSSCKRMA